jgi:hypothetical protein
VAGADVMTQHKNKPPVEIHSADLPTDQDARSFARSLAQRIKSSQRPFAGLFRRWSIRIRREDGSEVGRVRFDDDVD